MIGEGGCEGGFDVGGFGVFIVIGNVVAAGDDGEFFIFVGVVVDDDIVGVVVIFAYAMSDVSAYENGDSKAESFVEQFLHLA